MEIRPFKKEDAGELAELAAFCARGESDFVLNPYWESEEELFAEFARFGIAPEEHLLVADNDGEIQGLVGFLRRPGAPEAGMCAPIVKRSARGHGVGGELLRAARDLAQSKLGIRLVTAAIGTRNRAGYSLLTSHGFRPVRQHYLMRSDAAPSPSDVDAAALQDFEIDIATPDDAEGILEVYLACGFEHRSADAMRDILADGRHVHAVARRGSDVVAFCEIDTHWPRRVWVSYVGVDPALRDRGLGTALVTWSLARQFEAGAQTALLMLSPANRSALRAYEKGGFRRHRMVDVLENVF
jgi:ribosomal protein S18 acetylase RimI-like enzyme